MKVSGRNASTPKRIKSRTNVLKGACSDGVCFLGYLKENRWSILISSAIFLLIYLPWISGADLHYDAHVFINEPHSTFNWLQIGRQGTMLTKYLFGLDWFNPYFEYLMGYLALCLAGMVFGYLFWRASHKYGWLGAAFGLFCFTVPIMAEQLYYNLQIFSIALAYLLCAAAVGWSYYGILRKKLLPCIAAIFALIWSFSSYQSFVLLYVVAAIAVYILLYQRWTLEEKKESPPYWRIIFGLIAIWAISFVVNTIITNLFFYGNGSYLDSQIFWGTKSLGECIKNIGQHFKMGFLGGTIFYTPLYGIFAFLTILSVGVQMCRHRCKNGWLTVLATAVLQLVPFFLTIYMANIAEPRTQLAYPMVLTCDILICMHYIGANKKRRAAVMLLAAVLCWTQTQTTQRLIYTDIIRIQQDLRHASAIELKLQQVSAKNKPIAFVGAYTPELNNACISGNVIGLSAFSVPLSSIVPRYFNSSSFTCGLISTMGFEWQSVSQEQIFEARHHALNMPAWPAEGSVMDAGEYIIVKLGEDQWIDELLSPALTQVADPLASNHLAADTSMQRQITAVTQENGILQIRGWAYLEGINSSESTPAVLLHDPQTCRFYQMDTLPMRMDSEDARCQNGFIAAAPLEALEKPLKEYNIYISQTHQDKQYLAQLPYLHIEKAAENECLQLTWQGGETYTEIQISAWSQEDEQDDLVSYPAIKQPNGMWLCTVDLSAHPMHANDQLILHIYGKLETDTAPKFLYGMNWKNE